MKKLTLISIIILYCTINIYSQRYFHELPVGTILTIKKDFYIQAYESQIVLNTYVIQKYNCTKKLVFKVAVSNQNRIINSGRTFEILQRTNNGFILKGGGVLTIWQTGCAAKGAAIHITEMNCPLFDIFEIKIPATIPY